MDNNNLKKSIIPFFVVLVIISGIIFLFQWFRNKENTARNVVVSQKDYVENIALEEKYEKEVRAIILAHEGGESPEKSRNKLLTLVVPDKYKNLHIDLVGAFDFFINGDQATSNEKLNKIKEKYKWLK